MVPRSQLWSAIVRRVASLSIRAKLVVTILLSLMFLAGVVILGVRARMAAVIWDEDRESVILTTRDVEDQITSAAHEDGHPGLRERLQGCARLDRDISYIFVLDGSQRVLADTFERGFPQELLSANPLPLGGSHSVKPLETEQGLVWDVAVPLHASRGTVRVGISQARVQAALRGITTFLVVLTVCAATVGSLAACWLTSVVLRPVRQLALATEAIASGDLQQRVSVAGHDEIATLAASFNTMSAVLARSRSEIDAVNRELVRRNRELMVMNALATTMSRSLDLQSILNGAVETIIELLNARAGWIYLKDEQSGCLALSACHGFSTVLPPKDLTILPKQCAYCSCRQAMDDGTALVVHSGPVCLGGGAEASAREGLRCHMNIPLKSKDKVLGVMNLAYAEDQDCREEEIHLLTSIGHQIGMAVENARLYKNLWGREVAAQHMLRKLISVHEDERARIARELHDEAGQSLTALLLQLAGLEAMLPVGATRPSDAWRNCRRSLLPSWKRCGG